MTDMNLPVPLDWREIHRRPDNTRIVLYAIESNERFGVVVYGPDNAVMDPPVTFDDEFNAFNHYADIVEAAKAAA